MELKNSTKMRTLLSLALLLAANFIWAQSQSALDIALRHIEQNAPTWELDQADVSDMIITDSHISSISGVAHIYFKQRHQGIEVENAIINVSITADGKVLHVGKRAIPNIASKINATAASISAETALVNTLSHLELAPVSSFTIKETRSANEIIFEKGTYANRDVNVELTYLADKDGTVRLCWKVAIDTKADHNYWYSYVDAVTGIVAHKHNLVIECAPASLKKQHKHSHTCNDNAHAADMATHQTVKEALAAEASAVTNSYRVFALPAESPIHGPHVLVTDPADPVASPSGWHDDGNNQWTTTRGNNVFAYLDTDGNGTPDGPTAEGGPSLDFDFPYDASLEPTDMGETAETNLFYMNNVMHDFSFHQGFDSAAGNFQTNNFGNGGVGNDPVDARAQAAGLNNATFGTPPDGGSGVMNMFVWDVNLSSTIFTVNEPAAVAGSYPAIEASFGEPISDIPVTGEVAIVNDGIFDPYITDGCEEDFINASEIDGRIALVDRGGCFFEQKTAFAEASGAIALIICNFDPDPVGMAEAPNVPNPGIPTLMIGSTDCETIRQFAGNGLVTTFQLPTNSGPDFVDGDFDNGIIAHEFGHGISNRLTGGGSQVGCLGSAEQMGEGWSDFMALVLTVEAGDTGDMPRGIGNYAQRAAPDGVGIRGYPYSTDMNVSPLTYADLPGYGTGVHNIGEIWCNMIWDLYWAMTDEYGWDADVYTGTGGNNMAIKLVFEGMKLQPCAPGMLDGRDAIIAADEALYNGDNYCLIMDVFARRGLGFNASQGSPDQTGDGTPDFESYPLCTAELKLTKTVTPLVEAGESIDVALTVTNHKGETLTGVVVNDELEDGQSYVAGSANISDVTVNGNVVSFNIGEMLHEDVQEITYQIATDASVYSIQQWFDGAENDDDWLADPITNTNFFALSTNNPYEGSSSWFVQDLAEESQQTLFSIYPLTVYGSAPALRVYNSYNTQGGLDGGLIEISTDGGTIYQNISDKMIRGAYPAGIAYGTFVIPNLDAYSGNSDGYISSIIDMSDFLGEDIRIRLHFASDEAGATGGGWYADNIELMDLKAYNSETCATSDQGDVVCKLGEDIGTLIQSQLGVNTTSPESSVNIGVYPNPAEDVINLSIASKVAQDVQISIMSVDGREMMSTQVAATSNTQTFTMDVAELASGFYFVKASAKDEVTVQKVVIK